MSDQGRSLIYKSISYMLLYPREINEQNVNDYRDALKALPQGDRKVADLILSFIEDLKFIRPEDYVDLFDLSPKCPLYISHYAHEEEAERRRFELEVNQAYRSVGFSLRGGELPDYLPVVVEFLGLSPNNEGRRDFISRYLTPWLSEIMLRLERLKSPYHKLLRALYMTVNDELRIGGVA